jgi:hypothetical protein
VRSFEEINEALRDDPFRQKGDSNTMIYENPRYLIGDIEDFGMGLEAIGGGIEDHPWGSYLLPGQLSF